LDLTRDLHRLIAVDICDDAFDGRVQLLSGMFGKKDLAQEMSMHKDRSGTAGAGFVPPTSGNLRLVFLRTLFPLPRHCMSAAGLASLTTWLQHIRSEKRRLHFLISIVPMYHWAVAPMVISELMVFFKERLHAALFLAVVAAQIGPFCARSELINAVSRCGVQTNVIHAAAVSLGNMAKTDSSNLNGHYSLTLMHAMDSFLLRAIIHRDCFINFTLSQRNAAENRSRSREAQRPRTSSASAVEHHPSCLETLVLPPCNEDFEVPQLSSFAYEVLQHQILSLISGKDSLERSLQGLNNFSPQNANATNGAVMITAAGLEKLVDGQFHLLNHKAVVAFSIKCTSNVKVRIVFFIQSTIVNIVLQIGRERCYGLSHISEFLQKLLICYR
jgi:hypothetical protein